MKVQQIKENKKEWTLFIWWGYKFVFQNINTNEYKIFTYVNGERELEIGVTYSLNELNENFEIQE